MQKIIINCCYGGFGLSKKAVKEIEKLKNKHISEYDIERDDKDLVAIVQKLGKEANGFCANLKIVEIPDGIKWEIEEYDGLEHISEQHQIWS